MYCFSGQASHHGYVGAINGILGPNSWAGTQRGMRDYGYTGADNGIPGKLVCSLLEHLVPALVVLTVEFRFQFTYLLAFDHIRHAQV